MKHLLTIRALIFVGAATGALGLVFLLFAGPNKFEKQAAANVIAQFCRERCILEDGIRYTDPSTFIECLSQCMSAGEDTLLNMQNAESQTYYESEEYKAEVKKSLEFWNKRLSKKPAAAK